MSSSSNTTEPQGTEERETRNSVFSTPQHNIPLPQQFHQQQASQQAGSLDIELPAAAIPLPSRGLVYDKVPLMNCEELEIKAMTAQEEDILLNRTYIRNGTVITKLIQSCLLDKRINVDEMISGDKCSHDCNQSIRLWIGIYSNNHLSKM